MDAGEDFSPLAGDSVAGEHFVRAAVSAEDIEKLTVSEALTDTERAKVYAAGQPVQQQFLAHSLAGLVATSGPAAFVAIAPRLPQLADALDEEGQADIADCLAAILRAGQLPAAAVTEQVLPFVLPRTLAALTSDGNAGGSSGSSAGTNSHKSSHSSGAEGRTGGSFPNSSSSSFTGSCHGGSSGGSSLHEAWLGCFQALAGAVDRQTLYMRVLPAVLAVGASPSGGVSRQQRQQQPSVAERCVRCRLLAALAGALSAEAVELQLVGPAVSLCQDVESEVRAAMCAALPALGAALAGIAAPSAGAAAAPAPAALGGVGSRRAGTERAGLGALLREALQLLEDEEVMVRVAAWQALADLLQLADVVPATMRREVLALFLQQCQVPDTRLEAHRALTAVFGQLLRALVADMAGESDLNTALSGFRNLAWRHDPVTRANCATALPAVLRAATSRRYASHLHDTLVRLAADPELEVQLALARALPQVTELLGRERCVHYLRPVLLALLGNECREVQGAVLEKLVPLLEQFKVPGEDGSPRLFSELVELLVEMEAGAGRDWRLVLALLCALAEFPKFYDAAVLYERFLPLALKHMGPGAVAALVGPAANAVAAIWRAKDLSASGSAAMIAHQRTLLYGRLLREFAAGRSWRARAAFLDFCSHSLQRFSAAFFRAYLLSACSLLAYDQVPNVQLRLCALLPSLKQTISLPEGLAQLEQLNAAMAHLLSSTDAGVAEAARLANQSYKQQPVRTPEGMSAPLVALGNDGGNSDTASAAAATAAAAAVEAKERQDLLKRMWERELLFEPELLERIRAEAEAHDRARRPPLPASLSLTLSLPPPGGSTPSRCSARELASRAPAAGLGSAAGPAGSAAAAATAGGGAAAKHGKPGAAAALTGSRPPAAGGSKVAAAAASVHRRATSDAGRRTEPQQQHRGGGAVARAASDSETVGGFGDAGGLLQEEVARGQAGAAGLASGMGRVSLRRPSPLGPVMHGGKGNEGRGGRAGREPHAPVAAAPGSAAPGRAAERLAAQPRRATSTGTAVARELSGSRSAGAGGSGAAASAPPRRVTSTGAVVGNERATSTGSLAGGRAGGVAAHGRPFPLRRATTSGAEHSGAQQPHHSVRSAAAAHAGSAKSDASSGVQQVKVNVDVR